MKQTSKMPRNKVVGNKKRGCGKHPLSIIIDDEMLFHLDVLCRLCFLFRCKLRDFYLKYTVGYLGCNLVAIGILW